MNFFQRQSCAKWRTAYLFFRAFAEGPVVSHGPTNRRPKVTSPATYYTINIPASVRLSQSGRHSTLGRFAQPRGTTLTERRPASAPRQVFRQAT